MQRVLALGSVVSFTGILTFKNAQTVREGLSATPMGQFMLETDCPFLAPMRELWTWKLANAHCPLVRLAGALFVGRKS